MAEKQSFFFTCGQAHSHLLKTKELAEHSGGEDQSYVTWNKDNVLQVNAETEAKARLAVYNVADQLWCDVYKSKDDLGGFFPGGIVGIIEV